MKKILTSLFFVLMLLFNYSVQAEQRNHAELELPSLNVKLSDDGTGIIKGASCGRCDFNFVKITPNTRVYVNSIQVETARVAHRAGKPVFIEFDTSTAEVLAIRWTE